MAVTGPRSAVVCNPVKVLDLDVLRRTVEDGLASVGWLVPDRHKTTEPDAGHGQTTKAVKDGAEIIFVRGGDGTVTANVNGSAGTDVALAVYPAAPQPRPTLG